MDRSPARVAAALIGAPLAAALLALACSHAEKRPEVQAAPAQAAAAPEPKGPVAPSVDPLAAFETVKRVLQSPRCVNCHPAGDAPLQGDDSHVHLQNVRRGPDGSGVPGLGCGACHGKVNPPASYGARTPPGVSTGWHLPPPGMKMVFAGVGSRELCEQLKDPTRNGGKDMAALIDHVAADPLVLWGWSPGFGRAPVPVAHAEFVAAFKAWADRGAPCPER